MKTKHLLYLSQIFLLPIFLSTLVIAMISAEWWLTGKSNIGNMIFSTGAFNRPFTTIMFFVSVVGLSIIGGTILLLGQHTKDIDRLDDAIQQHYFAKLKYNEATRKVIEKLF